MKTRPKVTIVYRFLPSWRVAFFNSLRAQLADDGVELALVYGKNRNGEPAKATHRLKWGDEVELDWGLAVQNRVFNLAGYEFVWQSIPPKYTEADLVILMQENRLVSNYPLIFKQKRKSRLVALWGHGTNHQAAQGSLGNRFRKLYSTSVDWWFAYTAGVASRLSAMGFPANRITVVENAIDTDELRREAERWDADRLAVIKREVGLQAGPLALFCGSMYVEKRIPMLLETCRKLRSEIQGFQMIFIGDGPDREVVSRFCAFNAWARDLGPKRGLERVPFFKIADLLLMPGLLGLVIVDAFALELPVVTTNFPFHSPEIEYLQSGDNGVITEDSLEAFVNGAKNTLLDEKMRTRLRAGCKKSAARYTLQNMVEHFRSGIHSALSCQ